MKRHTLFVLASLTLAVQVRTALAQSRVPQDAQSSVLNIQSSLVVVPALVRTKAGDLVYSLTANDFVLTDDGIPQKLKLEQGTGGEPLALVVVVEVGGAGAREFDNDKLRPFAPMLETVVGNVPHKIAVVAFDSQPELVQDFIRASTRRQRPSSISPPVAPGNITRRTARRQDRSTTSAAQTTERLFSTALALLSTCYGISRLNIAAQSC